MNSEKLKTTPYSGYGNLNALRLALAVLVTWSHSYPLTNNEEPIARLAFCINGGSIGVWGFFFISGILVTESYRRHPSVAAFAFNRILRIWPALAIAISFTIYTAWLTSDAPSHTFVKASIDYFITNVKLIGGVAYLLPGAFLGNPTASVNGSLWTLPWEIRMYVVICVLGALKILWHKEVLNLAILFMLTLLLLSGDISGVSKYFDNNTVPWMLGAFLLGVFTCNNNQPGAGIPHDFVESSFWPQRFSTIRINSKELLSGLELLAFYFLILSLLLITAGSAKTGWLLMICGVVLILGFSSKIPQFKLKNDLSYGVYIFSFPVQQYLIKVMDLRSPSYLFVSTLVIVLCFGYASWHFIEKPFLKFKVRPLR